ncbi:hypothetical protein, partial [Actinoplanes sp. NPDC051411]|uniref:hypothetical protein n=1 Tax=Actinoplanes sp. NPDC051411 TaxID=3155522 RepID=UPI00344608B3
FTSATFDSLYYIAVTRPDGTTLLNTPLAGANAELDLSTLTQTGTYQVVIDPDEGATGDITTTLAADVEGGALSASGPSVPTTIVRPGQNSHFTFTGMAGQSLSLGLTGATFDGLYYLAVTRPDGTTVVNTPLAGADGDVDLPTLAQTGTYQVVLDPSAVGTGQATITLSADVDGGALTAGDPSQTIAVERPGQNGRFSLAATAGQTPALKFSDVTLGGLYTVTILRPDGTVFASRTLIGDNTITAPALTATGNYQVVIDPSSAATGSLSVALASN